MHDYIVVGAGPGGLTLALLLSKSGKSVVLIDKEPSIGGCHRVSKDPEGLFSDHGPRVYSKSYTNTIKIFNTLGINFDDNFSIYSDNFIASGFPLTVYEVAMLCYEFIMYATIKNYGRHTSVRDICSKYNFSDACISYLDSICRLTDGGDYTKYTMLELMGIVDYQAFYPVCIQNKPLDESIFPIWKDKLQDLGVEFSLNTKVLRVSGNGVYTEVYTDKGVFRAINTILAIPIKPLSKLKLNVPYDMVSYAENTSYIKYIHMTFHWDTYFDHKMIDRYKDNPLGIQHTVMSKYMDFKESKSKVVVSAIISKPENLKNNGEKIEDIIFRYFKTLDDKVPMYYKAILHDKGDTSSIMTSDTSFLPFETQDNNIKILGPYNGHSYYPATTMESAVSNAISLYNILENKSMKLHRGYTICDIFIIIIILITCITCIKLII